MYTKKGKVMGVTIIGDVHGKMNQYHELIERLDYSIQVGDMGFKYDSLYHVDPDKHVFIGGNHDNWDVLLNKEQTPECYLSRYGVHTLNGVTFFYIGGAFSVDLATRITQRQLYGKSWWHQEEMDFEEMEECKAMYMEAKPDLLITHSPPRLIVPYMTNSSLLKRLGFDEDFTCRTSSFLDHLLGLHRPKEHVFGHFHKDWSMTIVQCKFTCIPELGTYYYA